MALHKDFPTSPYEILAPEIRWFPADEAKRAEGMDKLMPPLVASLRKQVKQFRDNGYAGASATGKSLLNWWFKQPHRIRQSNGPSTEFQYYFAQREAIETMVYLYEVVGAKSKHDMLRFAPSHRVTARMFPEDWRRCVIKMATGSGKTKIMSLAIAWSFFHKIYEPDSELARNFLVIAPNIIVLDRLQRDFNGLRIFYEDPVLPENGYEGRNWRDDFQLTLHLQDEVRTMRPTGNIFLTNVHRIYTGEEKIPSPDDENTREYFLGKRPTGATTDSKTDLGTIIRNVSELMVLNDEAHHIHDEKLAWFKSIRDIHNRLLQKGSALALQVDVTATPKHNNGLIFAQTIADYPLVEAIRQDVVKHPVVPDAKSRAKLHEQKSDKFTEKYAEYIDLGVMEWRKSFAQHQKAGKKAILFIMTDDTRNCDEVAKYLRKRYPDFQDKDGILVIHTKNNGEISESSSAKAKEELKHLREQANTIDDNANKHIAIISVLMLKEGWDVRNVTTIVGLRAYSAKSNILPEQTLGRGLRKIYSRDTEEKVSVIGTDAFMEFVDSIQVEGVELEHIPMGEDITAGGPLVIEIDHDNKSKDINALNIEIPLMTPRIHREYKNLSDLDITKIPHQKLICRTFTAAEQREITFRDITTGEVTHTTNFTPGSIDFSSVIGYFARTIMKELRLVSGYDVLYRKVKQFIKTELFDTQVDIEDSNTLRNLSEPATTKMLLESFIQAINALTIQDKGSAEIRDHISLRQSRPFIVKNQEYVVPKKSVFNYIIGDARLELTFASFLETCSEVSSHAKNYFAVNFKLDYIDVEGNISNYHPDFIVRLTDGRIFIIETKGLADPNTSRKMHRLQQWCEDMNNIQSQTRYDFIYVDEEGFNKFRPRNFTQLITTFRQYKS